MEVNPSVPANTVTEFIAYAKANPGKVNMATGGIGSAPQVYGELFKTMTGLNLVPVHYRGSAPALVDLMAGQVQVIFDPIASSIGYIMAGKLRPLAVTTASRSAALPDIPTVGDFVPGYEASESSSPTKPRNGARSFGQPTSRRSDAMKLTRRRFLHLAARSAALPVVSRIAFARPNAGRALWLPGCASLVLLR
jgi:hypothetical protein